MTKNLVDESARQARAIYRYLIAQNPPIACRILRRVRTSQVLTFRLRLANPADLKRIITLDESLALLLGTDALRIVREGGSVVIETALDGKDFCPIPVTSLPKQRGMVLALGRTATGKLLTVDLSSPNCAHVLICGQTGSGKSEALRTVLYNLAAQNDPADLRLLLIDLKGGISLSDFGNAGHLLAPIIADPTEAIKALVWANTELRARLDGYSGNSAGGNGDTSWRLVVCIDEIQRVIDTAGDKAAAELIAPLTATGRQLGVHLICATQYATAATLGGGLAKANFGLRLVGRVADAKASVLATGQDALQAHKLRGRGDFLAVVGGDAHRLQVAQVSGQDIAGLPTENGFEHITFRVVELPALQLTEGAEGDGRREPKARPFTTQELALALTGLSINRLQKSLGIGGERASRLKDEAENLQAALAELGYSLIGGETNGTK